MSANPSPPPASLDFIPPVDLKGKTCLVTGGNVGVGFETVKYFAKFGATVIFTSRSMDDARRAADEIAEELKETDPDARSRLIPGVLDLSDLKNVRESVKSVVGEGALGGMLDVLVCNAGVFPVTGIGFGGVKVTKNGFEEMYQVNYLAHFLIIQLLMPQLLASAKARQGPGGVTRIVSQSSDVSFRGVCDLDNLNGEKSFGTAQFYANSKLMQVMMTTELAERLGAPEKSGIAVHAVHPGVVATNIARDLGNSWLVRNVAMPIYQALARTPLQGAATCVYVATSEEGGKTTGRYWDTLKIKDGAATASDFELCRKLYEKSLFHVELEKCAI